MARSTQAVSRRGGLDRRAFLSGAARGGAGVVLTLGAGGLLSACSLPFAGGKAAAPPVGSFTVVQVSDTHLGFDTEGVNPHTAATAQQVVEHINALPQRPALVVHTGDVTHLAKPEQFDAGQQILGAIKADHILYLPGEHDTIGDHGAAFRDRFIKGSRAKDYFSLDFNGAHIVGLSNIGIEDKFGVLGTSQLAWLSADLKAVNRDTPILVFAHVPLFPVFPPWGWATADADQAIALLRPFSSVTVLNGHIHQSLSHQIGNIRFHIAMSTAFPQHRPGDGTPGAYKLPADQLPHLLGYQTTLVAPGEAEAAVFDTTLATPAVLPG